MTYAQWIGLGWDEKVRLIRPTLTGYHATMCGLYCDGPSPDAPATVQAWQTKAADEWAKTLDTGSRTYASLFPAQSPTL